MAAFDEYAGVLADGGMIIYDLSGGVVLDRDGTEVEIWHNRASGDHFAPVVVVASLAAFLGSFVSGFAKEAGAAAGKASADAMRGAAQRFRERVRKHVRSREVHLSVNDDQIIVVVTDISNLTDEMMAQLGTLDLPAEPGELIWSPATSRWRFSRSANKSYRRHGA